MNLIDTIPTKDSCMLVGLMGGGLQIGLSTAVFLVVRRPRARIMELAGSFRPMTTRKTQ